MSKCLCYPTKKINSELRVRNYPFEQLSSITQNTLKSTGPAEVGEPQIKIHRLHREKLWTIKHFRGGVWSSCHYLSEKCFHMLQCEIQAGSQDQKITFFLLCPGSGMSYQIKKGGPHNAHWHHWCCNTCKTRLPLLYNNNLNIMADMLLGWQQATGSDLRDDQIKYAIRIHFWSHFLTSQDFTTRECAPWDPTRQHWCVWKPPKPITNKWKTSLYPLALLALNSEFTTCSRRKPWNGVFPSHSVFETEPESRLTELEVMPWFWNNRPMLFLPLPFPILSSAKLW